MAWLAPLWLAAVAAVAIPLLIHLRRRWVGRRIRVGSLRHLAGIAMPRRRRLQLRDPWLFALRGLIVALPAVALAEPVITRHDAAARWALVSPELVLESAARPVLDSLRSAGASVRLLAPGCSVPLLGEGHGIPSFRGLGEALAVPDSQVRLFGKPECQGHLPSMELGQAEQLAQGR